MLKYCLELRDTNNLIFADNLSLKQSIAELTTKIQDIEVVVKELKVERDSVVDTDSKTQDRLLKLEKECHSHNQYTRRDCIEVAGIDTSVTEEKLEEKVCEILGDIDVAVDPSSIQACHRLYDGKRTIVKFMNRKTAQNFLLKRGELANIDMYKKKVYINESLCAYYRFLHGKCKGLWNAGRIFKFWVSNGSVRYRLQQHGDFTIVRHLEDLERVFGVFGVLELFSEFVCYFYSPRGLLTLIFLYIFCYTQQGG